MLNRLSAMALATALVALPAQATETPILAAATPPQGPLMEVLTGCGASINADGAGVVEIDMREGSAMANPSNFDDRVKDGVVEISWGNLTGIGGRLPLSSVVELPYLTGDAQTASVAYWRMYDEGLPDAEFHDIVPLFALIYPQSGIHPSAPLPSLDDLGGRRVIAGTQTNAAVVSALGGVPLSISLADTYEAVQRGTADGRLVPWTIFPAFRMAEITRYHVEAPIGTIIGMVFVNRAVWEGLPEPVRAVIARHSGEARAQSTAALFDRVQGGIRAGVVGNPAHTVTSLSTDQAAAWVARLAPVATEWAANTPDGATILERKKALMSEVAAGK